MHIHTIAILAREQAPPGRIECDPDTPYMPVLQAFRTANAEPKRVQVAHEDVSQQKIVCYAEMTTLLT